MRILILGGTNFIGPYAVQRLVEMGHQVAVFHRGKTNTPLPESVQHLHGDRKQLADSRPAFEDFAPDVVLDMFPLTEQDGTTVQSVFQGIARRLVVISSVDVYRAYDRLRGVDPGPPDPAPLTEDSPLRDRLYPYRDQASGPDDFFYNYEKILVERAANSAPAVLPATVLRLPMVYGPRDYQRRLLPYLKRMDDGRPAIILSEDMASWQSARGYVEDMGHAIALCVTDNRAAGRIYHVSEPGSLSEEEWVRRIAEAAGWKGKIVILPGDRMPQHVMEEGNWEQDWSLDSSRIRQELGYAEPTSPGEAMRGAIEWQRANPPVKLDQAQFDYAAEDLALSGV